jgi:hypothetical protein
MDTNGLLNREGLWNRCGAALAGAFAAAILIGWNFYDFQQLLAALAIFSLVSLPFLAIVFTLVLAEQSAEHIFSRVSGSFPDFWRGLIAWLTVPPPAPPVRLMPLPFGPRLIREFQRMNKSGFRLPGRRAA